MTDQDKERIEKYIKDTFNTNSIYYDNKDDYFKDGAEYEHPIAFNQGIEAAKNLLKPMVNYVGDIHLSFAISNRYVQKYKELEYILEEIEKLKKI